MQAQVNIYRYLVLGLSILNLRENKEKWYVSEVWMYPRYGCIRLVCSRWVSVLCRVQVSLGCISPVPRQIQTFVTFEGCLIILLYVLLYIKDNDKTSSTYNSIIRHPLIPFFGSIVPLLHWIFHI